MREYISILKNDETIAYLVANSAEHSRCDYRTISDKQFDKELMESLFGIADNLKKISDQADKVLLESLEENKNKL